MNERQEFLQALFNDRVFAGSDNKLALLLGYGEKSRSTISRIKRGENVTPETVSAIWEKLCEKFSISDEDIELAAKSVIYGHDLWRELKEALGTDSHPEAFVSLLAEDYAALSPRFEEELSVHLNEIRLRAPNLYFGILAYAYIQCVGITPYTARGVKQFRKQLGALNDMLFCAFPTNRRARQAAEKIISFDLAAENITLHKLLCSIQAIFGNYANAEFFENHLRETGHLFDVGDDSFWFAPGSSFGSDGELWYWSVVETKSKLHGSYIAMRLRATADGDTLAYDLAECYNIMFMITCDEDCSQIALIYDIPTGNIGYAAYDYDSDTRRLSLSFDEPFVNSFNLPCELKCVNYENPQGPEERMWKKIAEKQIAHRCGELLMKAVNSSVESDLIYLTDYEVTNVAIDRKNITVTVEHNGKETSHTLSLAAYPFLEKITPAKFACVARSKSKNCLCISWNLIGQSIPLDEFTRQGR